MMKFRLAGIVSDQCDVFNHNPKLSFFVTTRKFTKLSVNPFSHKSKTVYDRKRLKKAGINFNDDLPLFILAA